MADNFDQPHPETAQAAPAGGDAPDFFDDRSEPSPVSAVSPAAGPAEPQPGRLAPNDRPVAPGVPIVAGLLLLGVLGAAWYFIRQPPPAAAPPPPAQPAAPVPAPNDALAGDVKDLKARVATLADRLKGLEEKFAGLPRPEPAPDLKPIQSRLDELAKSVEGLAPLSERVGKVDDRVGQVEGTVKTVRSDVDALKEEVKKAASAPASAPAPAAAASPAPAQAGGGAPDEEPSALARGADLFKAGRYKEASEAFNKLESSDPKDARVYYYAAMARGAATGEWTGETARLVTRGIELERAGSPAADRIDAAFADLPASLKRWLDAYRKRAR